MHFFFAFALELMLQTDKSTLVSRAYNELSILYHDQWTERNELLINPPSVKVMQNRYIHIENL